MKNKETKIKEIKIGDRVYIISKDDFTKLKQNNT